MVNTVVELTERAWAAGFFDGEGSTYIHSRKRKFGNIIYKPMMAVSQLKDGENILKRFQAAVGGLGAIHSYTRAKYKGRPIYQWSVFSYADTQTVMGFLWPYLCDVKKAQFKEVLATSLEEFKTRPQLERGGARNKTLGLAKAKTASN